MPKLDDDSMQTFTGNFSYSATRIENLGATEYTLVNIVLDISGSVSSYVDNLEKCIKEIIRACKYSQRADNLLVRIITFNQDVNELHGFKLLENCNENDYSTIFKPFGVTSLYDAVCNSINSTVEYTKELIKNNFSTNAVIYIITDGLDNASSYTQNEIKKLLNTAVKNEELESLITVLIGVGVKDNSDVSTALNLFHKNVGFTAYTEVDSDAKSFAKLGQFISKSISSQSQALQNGTIAQLNF